MYNTTPNNIYNKALIHHYYHQCRAIKQCMVKVNTWVFILRRYKWHIHAGSWSLVNCWWEGSTLPYKGCSWILMNAAVGLTAGLGLDGDRCIRVIPRQSETLLISYYGKLSRSLHHIVSRSLSASPITEFHPTSRSFAEFLAFKVVTSCSAESLK